MEEENIHFNKRKKVVAEKHYDIAISNQKTQIVNFLIKPYKSDTERGESVTLISKNKIPYSVDKADRIIIPLEDYVIDIVGRFVSGTHGDGNYSVTWFILRIDEIDIFTTIEK